MKIIFGLESSPSEETAAADVTGRHRCAADMAAIRKALLTGNDGIEHIRFKALLPSLEMRDGDERDFFEIQQHTFMQYYSGRNLECEDADVVFVVRTICLLNLLLSATLIECRVDSFCQVCKTVNGTCP